MPQAQTKQTLKIAVITTGAITTIVPCRQGNCIQNFMTERRRVALKEPQNH